MDSAPLRRDGSKWLTPARASAKFGVTAHSLRNWAAAGKISPIRTAGGHRRYAEDEVDALFAQLAGESA